MCRIKEVKISEKVYDNKGNILKSGGIITKEENDKKHVLLLYRKKWDDYTFPKGHLDPGENLEEAAIRETKEETGLDVKIVKALPDDSYTYPEGDGTVRVKNFLFEIVDGELTLEHKGDQLIWVPINKVSKRLSYDNLKEYYEKIREMI